MLTVFGKLAKLKGLRGGTFDIFGYSEERRMERRLIGDYRKTIEGVLPVLNHENAELVTSIAALADTIRGYGPIKEDNVKKYEADLAKLLASFDSVKLAKSA